MLLFGWHIVNDPDLSNTLLAEKLYNFFYQDVCKAPYATKHLHFIFDKVDGYIGKYHGTKYLPLFPSNEKYERMFGRTR